jgi:hypothetical protein
MKHHFVRFRKGGREMQQQQLEKDISARLQDQFQIENRMTACKVNHISWPLYEEAIGL